MRMLDPVDRWVPIWYQPIGMQNSPMNERDITSATRLHLLNLQFPIRPVLLNAEGQMTSHFAKKRLYTKETII